MVTGLLKNVWPLVHQGEFYINLQTAVKQQLNYYMFYYLSS